MEGIVIDFGESVYTVAGGAMKKADFEVIVVGGGHAGVEAALAAARMGCQTALLTMDPDKVALMPCNCSIGGPAKAHIAREIDALGGEMGRNIDRSYTHIRLLNTSKGPAVWALRAQADKQLYQREMSKVLLSQLNLTLMGGKVGALSSTGRRVTGVVCASGDTYKSLSVVVTTGTFLSGLIHMGETCYSAGRAGEPASLGLSDSLRSLGLELQRLKTGTVPRIDKDSLSFEELEVQPSSTDPLWFSFGNEGAPRQGLLPCWVTRTTEETRAIIERNLHLSALYAGRIDGAGPRYCPSIEDKMVKFPDKPSHIVFLEQEGWTSREIYVQGTSNSLPVGIQTAMLRSMPGMQNVKMLRPGYAVEYDFVPATQLRPSLEAKPIEGLFLAGQINGTSGYEEAAAQGLIAGINAAQHVHRGEPLVIARSEAYMGVLVDDLITKCPLEPYRMLTARAEFRLLLRQDNADLRLTEVGRKLGLVDNDSYNRFCNKRDTIEREKEWLSNNLIHPSVGVNQLLLGLGAAPLREAVRAEELLRRPEVAFIDVCSMCGESLRASPEVAREVETQIKFEGYIRRQREQVARSERAECQLIPDGLDYCTVRGLRKEGRDKLSLIRPSTVGQAGRITGVTPADVSVLSIHLKKIKMANP